MTENILNCIEHNSALSKIVSNFIDNGTIDVSPLSFEFSYKLSVDILKLMKITRILSKNIDTNLSQLRYWLLIVQKDIWNKKRDLSGIYGLGRLISSRSSFTKDIEDLYNTYKSIYLI